MHVCVCATEGFRTVSGWNAKKTQLHVTLADSELDELAKATDQEQGLTTCFDPSKSKHHVVHGARFRV